MLKKEKEITDPAELESIIRKARICRVAMVDGDVPYIVPLNFGYQDGRLYFHSALEGRKIAILKKNPNVCFELDTDHRLIPSNAGCTWGFQYRSIIGTGRIEFVENPAQKKEALQILLKHYSDRDFDFPDDKVELTAVYMLVVESMTGKRG